MKHQQRLIFRQGNRRITGATSRASTHTSAAFAKSQAHMQHLSCNAHGASLQKLRTRPMPRPPQQQYRSPCTLEADNNGSCSTITMTLQNNNTNAQYVAHQTDCGHLCFGSSTHRETICTGVRVRTTALLKQRHSINRLTNPATEATRQLRPLFTVYSIPLLIVWNTPQGA